MALAIPLALAGADKKGPAPSRGETETIELIATPMLDRAAIKQRLGSDLDGHYILMDVKIASRFGKEIDVRRDDFVLRTDKDGERSTPFAPSQIAGSGVLVISRGTSGGGGISAEESGPVWGGAPGTMGRPQRLGGDGMTVGAGGSVTEARSTARTGKANPLEATLGAAMLPEKKTAETLTGLLCFPLGKQKLKDLELTYKAADGKIVLRFK